MDDFKPLREWQVCYRESTVVFDGYGFSAKSRAKACKKARKWAMDNDHVWWSVYFIEELGVENSRKYGPFPYNSKWGKE